MAQFSALLFRHVLKRAASPLLPFGPRFLADASQDGGIADGLEEGGIDRLAAARELRGRLDGAAGDVADGGDVSSLMTIKGPSVIFASSTSNILRTHCACSRTFPARVEM